MTKELPHNEEHEIQVLGSLLCNQGKNIQEVSSLDAEDFYTTKNQIIFSAIITLYQDNIDINLMSVRDQLEKEKKLETIGNSSYLTFIMQLTTIKLNLKYCLTEIKRNSRLRQIWTKCQNLATNIENGCDYNKIEQALTQLNSVDTTLSNTSLKPISAKMLESIPPPQSLWGDIIYEQSITQINAVPGIGKTTLGYNLCGFGALEQEFLNLSFSKKIKSLVVDLETPISLRRHKLEMICGNLPEDMYFLDNLVLKTEIQQLIILCKRENFDIIIFDTQSRVLAMDNENDNAEGNFCMGLLRQLVNETGCALILMHHTTKSDESKGVYRGRGASAISGAVDVVVNIDELDQDTIKLKVEKTRFLAPKIELLIQKAGEDRFERHYPDNGSKSSGFEVYDAQIFILSLSKDYEWQTRDICEYAMDEGFQKRTIERALSGLSQSGKVKKLKHGVYVIPNNCETANSTNSAGVYPDGTVGMAETLA